MRNDIERLVFELGGKTKVAEALFVHTNTVRGWEKAGKIPRKYHKRLVELAEEINVLTLIEDYLK